MSNLSSVLRNRRKELGLTLAQIAEEMEVAEATVQRWESGNIKSIRYDKIGKLAEILHVSPAAIMGWDDDDTALPSQNPPSKRKDDTVQVHIMDFHGKEPEVITIPREKYEKMQRLLRAYEAEEEREKKNDPGIF